MDQNTNRSAEEQTETLTSNPDFHFYDNLKPLHNVDGYHIRPGLFQLNGATALPIGVNFTVTSTHATRITLLLFHRDETEPFARLCYPEAYRIGDVYSMIVFDIKITDFEYAYEVEGPYEPSKGLIFDKSHRLLDPNSKAIAGQSKWGEYKNPDRLHSRVVNHDFDWGESLDPYIRFEDLVIYEMHVRGFTKHPSSGVRCPGTFCAIEEKIPYLLELGINCVELMPVFEFNELLDLREHEGNQLIDYWGYNPISFFAPNSSYAASVEYNKEGTELKHLIHTLHENGIEVILDVVFNHTAEGGETGPTLSFKGFDNSVYYMLTPDGGYVNYSGCGNTLNANHPQVQTMILECLRYWVTEYRIDGFRFDLASILGRDEDGTPMNNPPLLRNLAFDPVLSRVKLIAEAWDVGGLYQVGSFPSWKRWSEWNGMYRDDLRRFLKGDDGYAMAAALRISGSHDLYDPMQRGDDVSVNFITCHDGFTLRDLYSYNEKHNEENGWNNTDGEQNNDSWNCGVEGETEDEEILALRKQMMRNAMAVLLTSHGTPMILAGDEMGRTQRGNNNAYCQDNEISWIDWTLLDQNRDMFEFVKYMIQLRKDHPVLRDGGLPSTLGFPESSYHGHRAWKLDTSRDSHCIAVMFSGRTLDNSRNDYVYIAINAYWEEITFELPEIDPKLRWSVCVNTADPKNGFGPDCCQGCFTSSTLYSKPRSVVIMISEPMQ